MAALQIEKAAGKKGTEELTKHLEAELPSWLRSVANKRSRKNVAAAMESRPSRLRIC